MSHDNSPEYVCQNIGVGGFANKKGSFFFECLSTEKRERDIIHWWMMETRSRIPVVAL
jgi:hypothetical protein